jgi:tRNA dimethylallyltransferase
MGSGNVENRRRQIVGILGGPTGSGKTAVGIRVAQALGLEILSADSGQARRGLEAGTAAPTTEEQGLIRHHLVGCLEPDELDTVVAFLDRVDSVLRSPGPDLFVVGGTGQYLSALGKGIDAVPAPHPGLRLELQDRWEREGREPLWQQLLTLNPSPPHDAYQNPVRLLRALEKAILLSQGAPATGRAALAPQAPVFALALPRDILHVRLETRLDIMLRSRWREEVALLDRYPTDAPCWKCIGYPELREIIGSPTIPARTRERILDATRQYAKRQETWLRNKLLPKWVEANRPVDFLEGEIIEAIQKAGFA